MQKIIEEFSKIFLSIPFNQTLGLTIETIHAHEIILGFNMKNELIGNYMHGILHGGVISSVLDMAGGVAVLFDAVSKRPGASFEELTQTLGKTSTINLQVEYLKPGKGEYFHAKASVLQAGNKITFTKMELLNDDRILIATGSATYLIG